MNTRRRNRLGGVLVLVGCLGFPAAVYAQHGESHGSTTTAEHGSGGHGSSEHASAEHGSGHGSGEHGAAHGEGHGEGHQLEPINWFAFGGTHRDQHGVEKPNPPPFLATIINFSLLALVLYLAIKRTINPALSSRAAAAEAELKEATRLLEEARDQLKTYKDKVANMQTEFDSLVEEFRRTGKAEAERISKEAESKAERIAKEGEMLVQQELRGLRNELLREAASTAANAAEAAVRKNIDTQDQTRLVDDYVANLEHTGASA